MKYWAKAQSGVVRKELNGHTFYQYETLPARTRAKLPWPTAEKLLDAWQLQQHRNQKVELAWQQEELASELRQARENWVAYYDTYTAACGNKRAVVLAKAHAVFVRLLELSGPNATPRRTYQELHGPFQSLNLEKFCTKSARHFSRQLKGCATDGIAATLLHGNLGNNNAQKATAFHEYRAEAYYSLPNKYSFGTIADLVKYECEAHGLPEVSENWVKRYLTQPNVLNRLAKQRHGTKYFTDQVQTYMERTTALHANDLWQMDGSPLQFICWNADRSQKIRLTLFVVLDVHSRKIVGYDMSLSEDRWSAHNALKRAIRLTGAAPYEVVNDNFSGGKAEEYRRVEEELTRNGVVFRKARVGNPQDKSQIERWFGTFQTRFCKHLAGYFGEGVTTRRLDGKANKDYLKHEYEVNGLPNLDTMLDRMVELIDRYNGTPLRKGGTSPNQLYAQSAQPNARPLADWQRALLFWPATTVAVRNGKVKLTVQKQEYVYELGSAQQHLALNGSAVEVRYNLDELGEAGQDVLLFAPGTTNLLGTARPATRIYQAQANQSQTDHTALSLYGKTKAAIEREAERQTAAKIAGGLAVVGADGALAFTDPRTAAKYERNDVETAYYREELGIDARFVTPEPNEPVAVRDNPYFGGTTLPGISPQDRYAGRLRREGDGSIWTPPTDPDDD